MLPRATRFNSPNDADYARVRVFVAGFLIGHRIKRRVTLNPGDFKRFPESECLTPTCISPEFPASVSHEASLPKAGVREAVMLADADMIHDSLTRR